MGKYSAGPTGVFTWQPSGSTTTTTIGTQLKNVKFSRTQGDAKSTGYGDTNETYVVTIADASMDFDLFLDDTTLTVEDLFNPGAKGTAVFSPAGTTTGKRKISFPGFVSKADDDFPYDNVAMRSVSLKPTGSVTYGANP